MAMLKLADKLIKTDDPEDAFCDHNNAKEYKGIFYGEDTEKRYYESGAHFSYRDLYRRLLDLTKRLSPGRVGVEMSETIEKSDRRSERESYGKYNLL
jgi:hypothetical protein